jgi:2-isopropylmalate synthase
VHPRHPYAGELVFTAFSGSHQDAINKGLKAIRTRNSPQWEVPYLPIDPEDVGRTYETVIRINSQSGKGGVAYVLEQDHGLALPRRLQIEFSKAVQVEADRTGTELTGEHIWECFRREYLDENGRFVLVDHRATPAPRGSRGLAATVRIDGKAVEIEGRGTGPIDAFVDALDKAAGLSFEVVDYHEHAVGKGADAMAVAYVEARADHCPSTFGVGMDKDIVTASLRAVTSAANRLHRIGSSGG